MVLEPQYVLDSPWVTNVPQRKYRCFQNVQVPLIFKQPEQDIELLFRKVLLRHYILAQYGGTQFPLLRVLTRTQPLRDLEYLRSSTRLQRSQRIQEGVFVV